MRLLGVRLLLALAAVLFVSCGEIFDVESVEKDEPAMMIIQRPELTLMTGDKLKLSVAFTPDELNSKDLPVYWMAEDADVCTFDDEGQLVAVAPGTTKIYATSVSATLVDEGEVTVIDPWAVNGRNFGREMMVYADVKVNSVPMTDDMVVAAFCDEELRGVGEVRKAQNKTYVAIRIYSDNLTPDPIPNDFDPYADNSDKEEDENDNNDNVPVVEVISFRVYDHKTASFYEMDKRLAFDGESHGTLSSLYEIKSK